MTKKIRILRVPESGYIVIGCETYHEVGRIHEVPPGVDPKEITHLAESDPPYIEELAEGSSAEPKGYEPKG